jgi:hypothetical protein
MNRFASWMPSQLPTKRKTSRKIVKQSRLNLETLEARLNPAIPGGLLNVPSLGLWAFTQNDYVENHSLTRNESTTTTIDQSGSGSSGTFTVDVVGSANATDGATGNSGWVTASGSAAKQLSYHLVMSGTYANGAFTITSQTYNETGSFDSFQTNTQTFPAESSTSTQQSDTDYSTSYSLSWTASSSSGGLAFTAYSYAMTESFESHTYIGYSDGGYSDSRSTRETNYAVSGSGSTGVGSGSVFSHGITHVYYPNYEGLPYEYTTESSQTDSLDGPVFLPSPIGVPPEFAWKAGTSDATGFTFHGVSEQSASLTESARYSTQSDWTMQFDVLSFSSTSHSSDTSHVIDDEPIYSEPGGGPELPPGGGGPGGVEPIGGGGTPPGGGGPGPGGGTGTPIGTFHRDELYTASNDATGSGSYVNDGADASYHSVDAASYAVNDLYTTLGEHSEGYDEDGEPFDLVFNYQSSSQGSGNDTETHDYHDSGAGLVSLGDTLTGSTTSLTTNTSWGTLNGVVFSGTTVVPASRSVSVSRAGQPEVLSIADGVVDSFPFRGFKLNNDLGYVQNQAVVIGGAGALGVTAVVIIVKSGNSALEAGKRLILKRDIAAGMAQRQLDTGEPQIRGSDTIKISPTADNPKGFGFGYAEKFGVFKEFSKEVGRLEAEAKKKWTNVTIASDVEISYSVEDAGRPKRSGYVNAKVTIKVTFSGTDKNGRAVSDTKEIVKDAAVRYHDESLENATLR